MNCLPKALTRPGIWIFVAWSLRHCRCVSGRGSWAGWGRRAAPAVGKWPVCLSDLLGVLETVARTPLRKLQGAYGVIQVVQPEELLVERVLVSVYPQPHPPARECAKKLAAVALGGALEVDWEEVRRLASRPEYGILPACIALVREVANELETKSPLDPND